MPGIDTIRTSYPLVSTAQRLRSIPTTLSARRWTSWLAPPCRQDTLIDPPAPPTRHVRPSVSGIQRHADAAQEVAQEVAAPWGAQQAQEAVTDIAWRRLAKDAAVTKTTGQAAAKISDKAGSNKSYKTSAKMVEMDDKLNESSKLRESTAMLNNSVYGPVCDARDMWAREGRR